jgi:hypothetical protein
MAEPKYFSSQNDLRNNNIFNNVLNEKDKYNELKYLLF